MTCCPDNPRAALLKVVKPESDTSAFPWRGGLLLAGIGFVLIAAVLALVIVSEPELAQLMEDRIHGR